MSELINTSNCPSALQKSQIEKQELLNRIKKLSDQSDKLQYEIDSYKTMYEELKKENEIMRETLMIIYNNTEPSTFYRYDVLQNSHDLIELAIPKEWK